MLCTKLGAFKCISPLESENCKFEIKYLQIKAILDVNAKLASESQGPQSGYLNSKLMLRWDDHFND